MDDVAHLGRSLLASLRQMDAEAQTPLASGRPAGLTDYGRHARPHLKRPQTEVCWSARLAELLVSAGTPAECERPYPGTDRVGRRTRRDLFVTTAAGLAVSVEVKGAWADYWGRRSAIYRSYLLHPLVTGLSPKSHTVPLDLAKLATLRPPETDAVALLLVGFQTADDPMDDDIRQLGRLAGLDRWSEQSASWESPTVTGQQVRCWFWSRAAGDASPCAT